MKILSEILKFPTDWEYIHDYIGFPAYMKPFSGGGWKSVYKVENPDDLFEKHAETGAVGDDASGRDQIYRVFPLLLPGTKICAHYAL